MRIYVSTNLMLTIEPPEVTIEHKDRGLTFSVSVFGRKLFQEEYDVFEELNGYWATLSESDKDSVFNIYSDIRDKLSSILFQEDIFEGIASDVSRLYKYHEFEDVKNYVGFKSNIRIPDNIPIDYVNNVDMSTSRDKTYIKSDYSQLMVLSLMLRPMIPIWGEHISNTRRDSGTHFKEYQSFKLLKYTPLLELEPMKKLHRYVKTILGDKVRPDSILLGISSENYSEWLLYNLCVRKLISCDLRGIDTEYNAMSYLHRYINQKSENRDNNYENSYKEKRFDDTNNDVSKLSILDTYKIKANISPGEIVELEHSVADLYRLTTKLSRKGTRKSLNETLKAVPAINASVITDVKLQLLSYALKDAISVHSMVYFNKLTIANLMCVAEESLWLRGHKYLAILASSTILVSESDLTINPVDTRSKIDPVLQEQLVKYFPYTKALNTKRKTQTPYVNIAITGIDELVDSLSLFTWNTTARRERVEEVFNSNTNRCQILPDIKNHLARLVLETESIRSY